jgi:lysozyme
MNIEPAIELIKSFEGLELTAYKCPAGVLTIGYGHTGPDVTPGLKISDERALELLRRDVDVAYRGVVDAIDSEFFRELTVKQICALVSFAFNVGVFAFKKSTMLRKINKGDYVGAAEEFARWKFVEGGQESAGLVRRRAAEKELFLK